MRTVKTVKYEEELCGAQEEKEQQRQLLDAVCKHPRAVNKADISEENDRPEQQEPEFPEVKEEKEVEDMKAFQLENFPYIKEEEDFTELPVTAVPLKNEDEGQYEVNRWTEPPNCSSSQPMKTEDDGEHHGGSQADSYFAPVSDSDDTTSHTYDTDDDDESEGSMASCSLGQGKQQRKYTVSQVLEQLEADDSDFGAQLDSDSDSDESFQPHESEGVESSAQDSDSPNDSSSDEDLQFTETASPQLDPNCATKTYRWRKKVFELPDVNLRTTS